MDFNVFKGKKLKKDKKFAPKHWKNVLFPKKQVFTCLTPCVYFKYYLPGIVVFLVSNAHVDSEL